MSSSAEEAPPVLTKTEAALLIRCPRCKAGPGERCTSSSQQYEWSRPYVYETVRPHSERYRKVAEQDKLARAKELGISRPELDRRRVRTPPSETALARDALRAYDMAEHDALRAWLRAYSTVLTVKETP